MPVRPPASLDDDEMSPIQVALKVSARPLAVVSVILSGAAYAILSTMAPTHQSQTEPTTADAFFLVPLTASALVMVASMVVGMAWTIARVIVNGGRDHNAAQGLQAKSAGTAQDLGERALHASSPFVSSQPRSIGDPMAPVSRSPEAVRTTSVVTTIALLAARMEAQKQPHGGYRTLISGDDGGLNPAPEILALVKTLSDNGGQVMLVDWSRSGTGLASELKLAPAPGLTELLAGEAGFEDVVRRVPGSRAHVIGCGRALDSVSFDIEPDQLNLVLDALDESYDYIVVAGAHDDARFLFEAILGRFDAGIVVGHGEAGAARREATAGTFLGFEVTDIDVVRFERKTQTGPISQQRISRVLQKPMPEARFA